MQLTLACRRGIFYCARTPSVRSIASTMKRSLFNSLKYKYYSSAGSNVLAPGDTLKQSRIFSASDITQYSNLTADFNPLHFDLDCAKKAGFRDIPVPGMLVASLFPRIIASHFPGAIYAKQTLEFKSPVFVGEEVLAQVEADAVRRMGQDSSFLVKFVTRCCIKTGDDNVVAITGVATAVLPTLDVNKLDNNQP